MAHNGDDRSASCPMNFLVSDQVNEVLIGVDWMQDHQCQLSFVDFSITLRGYRFPMLRLDGGKASSRILRKEEVLLPDRVETLCVGRVFINDGAFPKKSSKLQATKDKPGVGHVNKLRGCNFAWPRKGGVKSSSVHSCFLQEQPMTYESHRYPARKF